ncbi:MAG: acetylglutamate kinase [Oscillospiraceae bacterium]
MKYKEAYDCLNQNGLLIETSKGTPDIDFISYNSKEIKENTLFFCKGAAFSPKYLEDAIKMGAVLYVSEKKYDVNCDYIIVSDIRKAMAYLSNAFYEYSYKKLNLTGITGTKGKSTTAYYIKYILDEFLKAQNKPKSGIISSIDTYDGTELKESILTTPEAVNLHKHFYNAVNNNIEFMTMEVSSQALKYDRVLGVNYNIGCFLNFGEDHISPIEHIDIDDYFNSKMILFSQCDKSVISLDDEYSKKVLKAAENTEIITFSRENETADFYGYDIRKENNDIAFKVRSKTFDKTFRITMPGIFNVYNALCAIAVTSTYGVPSEIIYKGLIKARTSGRMENYSNETGKIIAIVDYAHNKLSFQTLYNSVLNEYKGRKIITVFGCPGKKAINRREDLGLLAGEYSDKVIITEEDFGEEDVMKISNEIKHFVDTKNCPNEIITDRGEAIKKAIMDCDENSLILITGKGNETRLKRGREYCPCLTDVDYVKKYLKEYDVKNKLDNTEKIKDVYALLPLLSQNKGKTFVIKYGGSSLGDEEVIKYILDDIKLFSSVGINVVVVHGGGNSVSEMSKKLGIEPKFYDGYRITDDETVKVAEMVLSGEINKSLVSMLNSKKDVAVGISGKDAGLIKAKIKSPKLGLVGEVISADPKILKTLLASDFIPVVSPISSDGEGQTLNINADDVACAVAESLKADKLVFMTDTDGIYFDNENENTIIHYLNSERANDIIENGLVEGGMAVKLKNCLNAIECGVGQVSIIDGRREHTLLLESISERNYGTVITNK